MNFSAAIMAHPDRADLAAALERRLRPAEVVLDDGEGEWATGRRALLAFDPEADYHAVIQDDAIVPEGFTDHLARVLAAAEGYPLGLYVGRVRPREALISKVVAAAMRADRPWLQMRGPYWGVAVAFPTSMIPELVERADTYARAFYDTRLRYAVKAMGWWCRYPIPSLVDHDPAVPSLIHTLPEEERRAHVYIGDRDPASISWNRPPVVVTHRGKITVPSAA